VTDDSKARIQSLRGKALKLLARREHTRAELARKLAASGMTAELLARVARADHFGRTTEEALARRFPAGDEFLARARELAIEKEPPRDVVLGRHLIARGLRPGPEFGAILERCRELQDENGWTDPEQILARVLDAP